MISCRTCKYLIPADQYFAEAARTGYDPCGWTAATKGWGYYKCLGTGEAPEYNNYVAKAEKETE